MIITKQEHEQVIALLDGHKLKGRTVQTKIIYDLWQRMFGIRKRPNGCGACMKTDLNNFVTKWNEIQNDLVIEE